jgi:hypothetical protein
MVPWEGPADVDTEDADRRDGADPDACGDPAEAG